MEGQLQINNLESEIKRLKDKLKQKEDLLQSLKQKQGESDSLSSEDISRYSRQMLVPQIGVNGQKKLKKGKVLIVGIGGLGCPAALYLTAAGVGEITLVDDDEVDLTNLHRQILHTEEDIGVPKVLSAFHNLCRINSKVKIIPMQLHANSKTFDSLLKSRNFDVVIDGSDNVATRYLLNDACVLNNIPLVSGSALQLEGQLTVYNYKQGPCYRCLFPIPPPPETVTSCGDGGVLGPVPGIMGVLEALEAIKIIIDLPGVLSKRLLLFDASEGLFRNVKLRNRNENCQICGEKPTITSLIDYEEFCAAKSNDKVTNISILREEENVGVAKIAEIIENNGLLIDVRPKIEYEMCHLPKTLNFPLSDLEDEKNYAKLDLLMLNCIKNDKLEVYVMCRRGNDSQRGINKLKELFNTLPIKFYNIQGGLHNYSKSIDNSFPVY